MALSSLSLQAVLKSLHAPRCSHMVALTCVPVRWRSGIRHRKFLKEDAKLDWAAPLLERKKKPPMGEPYMLHVVTRVQPLVCRPWWEKDIIKKLELDGPMHHPVLTKNTPENNRLLAEVKHLVHIQPLRLPHGLPSHPSDYEHTMVTSDGRLVVKRRLAQHEPAADSEDDRATWRLQPDTVKARLDRGRVTHMVHTDEHKTQYVYKRNQDGKEYRYNFNKPSTD